MSYWCVTRCFRLSTRIVSRLKSRGFFVPTAGCLSLIGRIRMVASALNRKMSLLPRRPEAFSRRPVLYLTAISKTPALITTGLYFEDKNVKIYIRKYELVRIYEHIRKL